jgi:adenylosuccinate synthase
MGAIVVVDAFWGDSGKGKIAAYLSQRSKASFCVRAGTGTNAGHSIYFEDGKKIKTNQLPCGWLYQDTQVRVGSGVAVDPEKLLAEMEGFDADFTLRGRTKIDFRCPIILPEYKRREAEDSRLRTIGSTASGTGVALAEFRLRQAKQAKDIPAMAEYLTDVAAEVNTACGRGEMVIIEGSQGTHLSLALSKDYPFCTSDNCTVAALADDVGLNWQHIQEVILVVKAMPSRVGEGPLPFQLSADEEEKRGIVEYGVTTGRRRRKASRISWEHFEYAVMLNGPTQIALTFCDHFDPAIAGARCRKDITSKIKGLIDEIEQRANVPVTLIETGKFYEDIIDRAEGLNG